MNTIPNFDAMSHEDLMVFWNKFRRPRRKSAEKLIGDRRPGYTSLASTLANLRLQQSRGNELS